MEQQRAASGKYMVPGYLSLGWFCAQVLLYSASTVFAYNLAHLQLVSGWLVIPNTTRMLG